MDQTESGSADSSAQDVSDLPSGPIPEVLTFLFADVRGYSTFASQRGDAAAAMLALKFADLARDAVEARSGRVLELRGDEVFAVFRAAAQGVRAAVELQATFAEESQLDPMFQLPVGMGIDTGEAVPVEEGYRGVAVNMAARLCSSASAGQVLVTRTVTDHLGATDGIVFAERGPATFKGFDDPVDVIEALPSLRPTVEGPANGAIVDSRLHAPEWRTALRADETSILVGREHEMRWARGTWRSVRRGNGRVVCVSGPSQIGKTRLATEIASYVDDTGGSVWYSGAGGTALADALNAVHAGSIADRPTIVILDDIDAEGPELADAAADALDAIAGRPSMVVLIAQSPDGLPALGALVERIDVHGDGHRRLSSLDQQGVREIGRTYLGDNVEMAPLEAFFRSSGGVPGRVHEVVSGWAREEATRRLSAAAEWLVGGRTGRANDLEFANNVLGLKLDQLFRAPGAPTEEGIDVCPYKGLATFGEEDARFFFGRERLVGELAARSVDVGMLGIIGASGSGKSSVISAGLGPSLAAGLLPGSERWQQVSLRPGEHPMTELRAAIGPPAAFGPGEDPVTDALARLAGEQRLVVVVDQFEEAFTTCTDDGEREAFIGTLTGPALAQPERLLVIVSLRADFYGQCAAYPLFARMLGDNHVLLGPMSKDELRRAIELPARRTGLRVESALTDRLVEDVVDEPGGLPLLSTTLVELWQQREDGWLRADTYQRSGGVQGAVARLAEGTYGELTESEREVAPGVFLRLVGPGEGEAVTRRRVPVAEFDLDRSKPAEAVIARFTQDRLLTRDEGTVEVAHEALLREWPRLQTWLAEDSQGREIRTHLAAAARAWKDTGEEDSELYRGARLSATLDWAQTSDRQLNDLERRFLTAGRQSSEREIERARRTNRRLKASLVGVALFLVVAIVGGSIAVEQRGRAKDSARVADARRVAAQALAETHLDRALMLALAGVRLDDTLQTESALLQVLQRSPAALAVVHGPGSLDALAISADGKTLAMAAPFTHKLELFDIPSRTPVGDVVILDGNVNNTGRNVAFVPHHHLVVAGVDGADQKQNWLDFVNTDDPRLDNHIPLGKNWFPESIAASADGRWVVVGNVHVDAGLIDRPVLGHEAVVFDTTTGSRVKTLQLGSHDLYAFGTNVIFSPDGRRLVTSIAGKTVVWNTRSWEPRREYTPWGRIAMSPDGRTIAIGENDGSIRLVDVHSGPTLDLRGSLEPVGDVAFSEDGQTLFSAYRDQKVRVWDVPSAALVRTFSGHAGVVCCVVPSPDGRTVYSGSEDGTVIAWDVEGRRAFDHPIDLTRGDPRVDVPFIDAAGNTLAVSMDDRHVGLWNTDSWRWEGRVTARNCRDRRTGSSCRMGALALSPEGRYLLIATAGRVTEWDLATRSRDLPPLRASAKDVWGADFSPDGSSFITFGESVTGSPKAKSELQLRDTRSGGLIWRATVPGDAGGPATRSVEFSPDGSLLAVMTCCFDGPSRVEVLDAADGHRLVRLRPGTPSTLAFSPDGTTLAIATTEGISFWDPRTGQSVPSKIASGTNFVSLSYSADGRWLAATDGNDGTVLLWDVATGTQLGAPFSSSWFQTIFSSDGKWLIGNGGAVWTLDENWWERRACEIAGRDLSPAAWQALIPSEPYQIQCSSP